MILSLYQTKGHIISAINQSLLIRPVELLLIGVPHIIQLLVVAVAKQVMEFTHKPGASCHTIAAHRLIITPAC